MIYWTIDYRRNSQSGEWLEGRWPMRVDQAANGPFVSLSKREVADVNRELGFQKYRVRVVGDFAASASALESH